MPVAIVNSSLIAPITWRDGPCDGHAAKGPVQEPENLSSRSGFEFSAKLSYLRVHLITAREAYSTTSHTFVWSFCYSATKHDYSNGARKSTSFIAGNTTYLHKP